LIMFDRVKHVEGWTTLACHVYDSFYCWSWWLRNVICNLKTWRLNV
jgi:hypothetical protein